MKEKRTLKKEVVLKEAPDHLRLRELLAFDDLPLLGIPYSRVHLYRLIKVGAFPQPVRVGVNRVAFVRSEIMSWIKSLQHGVGKPRAA